MRAYRALKDESSLPPGGAGYSIYNLDDVERAKAFSTTMRRSRVRAPIGNEHKAKRCVTALSFRLLDRGPAPSRSLRASAHANLRYLEFFRLDEFPGRNHRSSGGSMK